MKKELIAIMLGTSLLGCKPQTGMVSTKAITQYTTGRVESVAYVTKEEDKFLGYYGIGRPDLAIRGDDGLEYLFSGEYNAFHGNKITSGEKVRFPKGNPTPQIGQMKWNHFKKGEIQRIE